MTGASENETPQSQLKDFYEGSICFLYPGGKIPVANLSPNRKVLFLVLQVLTSVISVFKNKTLCMQISQAGCGVRSVPYKHKCILLMVFTISSVTVWQL